MKMKNDDKGQSTLTGIAIIIILLIIWQYAAPFLDIASLTETFGITETDPEELTFSAGLFNTETNLYRTSNLTLFPADIDPRDEHENLIVYDLTLSGENSIANHQIIINTNAPKRISNPYRVIIIVQKVYWNHDTGSTTIYTNSITSGDSTGDKEFKRQLIPNEVQLSGVLNEYSVITCRLLESDGSVLFSERWAVR